MLAKCLKYDLKSVFRIWWIAAVAVLGLSVPTGFALRILYQSQSVLDYDSTEYALLSLASTLTVMLAYFAIIAFSVMSAILVYVRFYRNFFTDEGYLTFTLPVSRKNLLFSKVLNGMIWSVATEGVLAIFGVVVLTLIPAGDVTALEALCDGVSYLVRDGISAWILLYGFELHLMGILATLVGYLWIYFCITLASVLVRKNRVILSIGLIYGTGQVLSLLYYVFIFGFSLFSMGSWDIFYNLTELQGLTAIALGLLLICVILVTVAVLLWNAILGSLERKLNMP